MTDWIMNTGQLEKGMMIRRLGLDESLEVVNVRNGQAKIKLPDGKTSTIPASAEVEWSRPESNPETASNPQPIHISDVVDASGWLTDWTLLDVGSKIAVLGEPGDFTILRLTDSNARIKHNATGQIQPLTIGHKFKILDSGSTAKADGVTKDKSKAKRGRKASAKPASLPLEEPEPSDEELTAIENGDGDDDIEIESSDDEDLSLDPESLEDLEDDEDDDTDEDKDDDANVTDTDTDDTDEPDDDEENEMPKPQTSKPAGSKSRSTSLLTVGQISERTGISYPTLMRYIRDHGDRLPSEGEGRARRFLPESIDVFRQIRSETKGGRKPGSGSQSASKSAKPRRSTKPAQPIERSHETAAPYAAPARSQSKSHTVSANPVSYSTSSGTLDQALVSAIDHARAQISGLESLIDNLEAQREALKLWN